MTRTYAYIRHTYTLLILLTCMCVSAHASPLFTLAVVQFSAPDGTEGIVTVARNNTSAVGQAPRFVTTLYYSFCLKPVPQCLNGYGTVPNSVMRGMVTQPYVNSDVLTVIGDTNTWAGYVNEMCYWPDEQAVCTGGQMLAPGGLITLRFTKTRWIANVDTTLSKSVQPDGTVTNSSHVTGTYSASATGSVIGQSVVGEFYATKVGMVTGTWSQSVPVTVAGAMQAMGIDDRAVSHVRHLEGKQRARAHERR